MAESSELNLITAETLAAFRKDSAAATLPSVERRAMPPIASPRRPVILVNNESTDVPPGGCLAIVDTYQSGYGPIFLKCAQPSTTFYRHYTFAPLTGLPANGQAPAQDGPHYYALYNSGSPANDDGYGPTPGQYYLTKNYPQCATCIGIWDSSAKLMLATSALIDTAVGFAPIDIDGATGDISDTGLTPGSGSVRVCYFDGTKWLKVDDSYIVLATNLSTSSVTSNTPLQLKHINGLWLIDFESCDGSGGGSSEDGLPDPDTEALIAAQG